MLHYNIHAQYIEEHCGAIPDSALAEGGKVSGPGGWDEGIPVYMNNTICMW